MNYLKLNRRFGILTISSVFLLLLAGGFVRSTGSGMGCPDWPKCYGAWYPPTCACELPDNYQTLYVEKRIKKAEKFSNMISKLGFKKEAKQIMNDPKLTLPEIFNTRKAWTEYINRLIGALSGLFSLIFVLSLFKIRNQISSSRFIFGIIGFILMLFNAWLGSIVVATNLFPILITIHYLAAYSVIAFFILSIHNQSFNYKNIALTKYKYFYLFFIIISLVQVIYGTQLRQISEHAIENNLLYNQSEVNYQILGFVFKIHWALAVILTLVSAIPAFLLRNKIERKNILLILSVTFTLMIQYLSGVLNLKLNFPLVPQVSHILFAGLVFGISLYICIGIFKTKKN